MSIDVNDEILQDFLVEAGEILEQLDEQLVDLEQQPDDIDLLNAVFRGFHTIKGGAGFLSISALVEICHRAEDVFNVLRQGQRAVSSDLMDSILQVLDAVNSMFDRVREGADPEHADPELIQHLNGFAVPEGARQLESATVQEKTIAIDHVTEANGQQPAAEIQHGELSDHEFEDLLEAIQEPENLEASSDEITEEEFENILDEIHGKGQFNGGSASSVNNGKAPGSVINPNTLQPDETTKSNITKPIPTVNSHVRPDSQAAEAKVQLKSKPAVETTVRVDTQRLDDIMNMVGELVLVRNRLTNLKAALNDEDVANAVGNLDVVTADLQLAVMKTRMQPIKKVFGRFPRVVRDLARSLKKEIDLEMEGEETDLDKNLVEALADPLVHLVRNSVDHGIENPSAREKVGKPRRGTVLLSAAQEGDHILLSISDDGKGMDPEVLRRKAVESGLMDQEAAARLNERECYNLIFQAGFSTKQEISDVSGRGVGMDVVKTRIAQMNGSVEIDSEMGRGSLITIKLPLTLAILPTLMVVLKHQPFALPLANVVEIFNLDLKHTNVVDGQLTIMVRERAIPLFYLREWLVPTSPVSDTEKQHSHVVIVNVGNIQVGLAVDELIGQEEVVIKPLGAMLQGLEGMAGATITGDGKIALIIDVPGLMRKYARKY